MQDTKPVPLHWLESVQKLTAEFGLPEPTLMRRKAKIWFRNTASCCAEKEELPDGPPCGVACFGGPAPPVTPALPCCCGVPLWPGPCSGMTGLG